MNLQKLEYERHGGRGCSFIALMIITIIVVMLSSLSRRGRRSRLPPKSDGSVYKNLVKSSVSSFSTLFNLQDSKIHLCALYVAVFLQNPLPVIQMWRYNSEHLLLTSCGRNTNYMRSWKSSLLLLKLMTDTLLMPSVLASSWESRPSPTSPLPKSTCESKSTHQADRTYTNTFPTLQCSTKRFPRNP